MVSTCVDNTCGTFPKGCMDAGVDMTVVDLLAPPDLALADAGADLAELDQGVAASDLALLSLTGGGGCDYASGGGAGGLLLIVFLVLALRRRA
jgi:hypothetical protein